MSGAPDVTIVPIAYELTTSYGLGTADGPQACIEASAQVELYDPRLEVDLPAGYHIQTQPVWEPDGGTLRHQLDEMADYASSFYSGTQFPLFLGGEHGILPPIVHAMKHHPLVMNDATKVTIVQIDAHADLREELDGEIFSHACAASRALDVGAGRLLQCGIRAYSKEEHQRIKEDDRITTFFAKDTQHPTKAEQHWKHWIDALRGIEGIVHLTIDIDGLDGSLVPATGTPVPGGLGYWQVIETIEEIFSNQNATVISADVNEITPQVDTPLTQFTAACVATKIVVEHLIARKEGRWMTSVKNEVQNIKSLFFQTF